MPKVIMKKASKSPGVFVVKAEHLPGTMPAAYWHSSFGWTYKFDDAMRMSEKEAISLVDRINEDDKDGHGILKVRMKHYGKPSACKVEK